MSKYQYFMGRLVIGLCSIIIGIPVGIFLALIYFVRISLSFPFQMYARAVDKWERKVQIEQADIWTRHVARMEQESRTNINNN
tara:strand:+ start:233 stop:481 length:249 start_codon:yes stop_codon:yes gene_type:complete